MTRNKRCVVRWTSRNSIRPIQALTVFTACSCAKKRKRYTRDTSWEERVFKASHCEPCERTSACQRDKDQRGSSVAGKETSNASFLWRIKYTIRNSVVSFLNKIYRLPVYDAVENWPLTSVGINSPGWYLAFFVLVLNMCRHLTSSHTSHCNLISYNIKVLKHAISLMAWTPTCPNSVHVHAKFVHLQQY